MSGRTTWAIALLTLTLGIIAHAGAAPDAEPTRVVAVWPKRDKLPANLLKFYVEFSRPVRQTDRIFDQMHILDDTGKRVYDPWRRFHQWSDDGTRLTLWIHPGRVKQGVNLREEFGPVLQPGHGYTLVIDAAVEDLEGRPLAARFEKRFTALDEDHTRPTLEHARLLPPIAGSRDPLIVDFSADPVDHLLAERLMKVTDSSGRRVNGAAQVSGEGGLWRFVPAEVWRAETYTLHLHELLEDLAGNTPVRVFDTDLTQPQRGQTMMTRRFTPQAARGGK